MIEHFNFSFVPGILLLDKEHQNDAQKAIFNILGAKDMTYFSRRKHRYRDIPHHIYTQITEVFARYGIPEDKVWIVKPA